VIAGVESAVARAFHNEWARIVASLIRTTGDWDLAEECAQDAFVAALRRWPSDGIPQRPGAWLTTVARNRAVDRLRRSTAESAKLRRAAALAALTDPTETSTGESGIDDDRLRLIFTCCHPALPLEARVALTLRTLAGLSTAEIARAFLVPEATMAKRLVRAKHKIRNAAIPYRVPAAHLLPERMNGVLAVLYLLFNEGYTASAGAEIVREDLCGEAIRLATSLSQLMPEEPEVAGLLALMLFQHSRRRARADSRGELVTLEDQDRSVWDRSDITRARDVLHTALRGDRIGPYQLQAAIAAQHARADVAAATDWPEITRLYALLADTAPSPIVELNRAVAVAMTDGPAAGLTLLQALEATGTLNTYYLLHATQGEFQRRLQRYGEAAESFQHALALTNNDTERRFLAQRLNEVINHS
jgi:RNA polymerase sigma-70 factor (ECF subfamily)